MIVLPEGESYEIKSLNDLLNCPTNMTSQAIKAVFEIMLKRINMIDEKAKRVDFENITITLINDGIDKSTIEIRKKEQ